MIQIDSKIMASAIRRAENAYEAGLLKWLISRAEIVEGFDDLAEAWKDLMAKVNGNGDMHCVLDIIAQQKRLAKDAIHQ